MRNSLIEIKGIEKWIEGQFDEMERLLFESKLIIDKGLGQRVALQKEVLELVRMYGRDRLKRAIKQVEKRLLTDIDHMHFQQQVHSIFKS